MSMKNTISDSRIMRFHAPSIVHMGDSQVAVTLHWIFPVSEKSEFYKGFWETLTFPWIHSEQNSALPGGAPYLSKITLWFVSMVTKGSPVTNQRLGFETQVSVGVPFLMIIGGYNDWLIWEPFHGSFWDNIPPHVTNCHIKISLTRIRNFLY